jgi:hypothetical protein
MLVSRVLVTYSSVVLCDQLPLERSLNGFDMRDQPVRCEHLLLLKRCALASVTADIND